MDFLDFIPSRTVKDFVRKSNYQLTAKDAGCIVFVLRGKTNSFPS